MSAADPWWLTNGVGELDTDEDPLVRHLAGRRGGVADPTGDPVADPTGDPVADEDPSTGARRRPGGGPADDAHGPDICGVCPICRGWSNLQGRHPEIAGHVAEAARHLALALARLADVADTASGRGDHAASTTGARDRGFTPIRLDDMEEEP